MPGTTAPATFPAIPLGPNHNGIVQFNTAAAAFEWLDHALRGVERGRGDEGLFRALAQDGLHVERVAHVAALIERARLAEREATIVELAGNNAAAKLLADRARAEGHAAGRAEAAAEAASATAARDAADRAAAQRRSEALAELGLAGT